MTRIVEEKKSITGLFVAMLLSGLLFFTSACNSDSTAKKGDKTTTKSFDNTVKVSVKKIVRYYEAVGTIRPETEASIESQINAQIKKVLVGPGDKVKQGQPLVKLDDSQYSSQLDRAKEGLRSAIAMREQANQGLEAAKAGLTQAEAAYKRTKKFFESQAATAQQLEQAESAWKQARAGGLNAAQALMAAQSGIKQAEEVVKQAELTFEYTIIKAPADGIVLKKTAEVGDIAIPGRPLLLVRTNNMLRIEASVREGLISQISIGQKLDVNIKNMNINVQAVVVVIEPYADPHTRTFLVKAVLPEIKGMYPGMYGKLLVPEKEEEAVILPAKAVKTVGQLKFVNVLEGDRWYRRFITTGSSIDNEIEILSGLKGTETVGY